MKFSNLEIERLAREWVESDDSEIMDTLQSHKGSFGAGFQKCLEMLKERMPTDIEISREYGRKGIVRDFILERLEGKK